MKKITLCADDYGQNQSISQAIIALLEKNRLTATSCMTTAPTWPEHAKWLHPLTRRADIGLHFNLTEGKPLSASLLNSHGFFPLSQLLIKSYRRLLDAEAIEVELNAQLDAFEAAMGCMPDFIDGHQHIHQLPVIRDVLLKVYNQRLSKTDCYIRCVHDSKIYLRLTIKKWIIQLLGARSFKKRIIQHNIPHNSSFSGIYPFSEGVHYSRVFRKFLAQIKDGGLIMCHPGMAPVDKTDVIAESRFHEYLYLESDQFVLDCFHAGVVLDRLVVNKSIK